MIRRYVRLWIAAALLGAPAAAGAEGIHIKSTRTTSWQWMVTDGAGYRWDIYSTGQVNDGTNDAYDGGMVLRVGGTQFSWSSNGKLNKDGTEVEIGPWTRGSVKVWRRIYIDKKGGYCRWIDIFENTSGSTQTVAVQYYTNQGSSTYQTYTTSGRNDLTDKDWGIVTASSSSSSSRPALIHVFATKNSKFKPRFQWSRGNDNVYYHANLKVPGKKTVALCFFEMQRRPYAEAQKALKAFKPEQELKKVPSVLRRIILNMGGAVLTLGRLELPRNEDHDLVVLQNGNELLGTIGNERFAMETAFGKIELPADRVVGLSVSPQGDRVELGLVDGQVLCGQLANGPVKLKLATGSDMELPTSKIRTAAYRLSEKRPDEIALTGPVVVLRTGERVYFSAEEADLSFHTRYGPIKLTAETVKTIYLDTPEGGLHRAVFRNGSVLSGLLTAPQLKASLKLGPTLAVSRHVVEHFLFPGADDGGEPTARLRLRNDDELLGRIVDKKLTVQTRFGPVVAAPADVAEIVFRDGSLGRVQIKLHNGTTISGRFEKDTIGFQIGTDGPTLNVSVGHVAGIQGKSKDQPIKASGTGAAPAPKPAVGPTRDVPKPPAVPVPAPPVRPVTRLKAAAVVPLGQAVGQVQGRPVVVPREKRRPAGGPATRSAAAPKAAPKPAPATIERTEAEIKRLKAEAVALDAKIAKVREVLANTGDESAKAKLAAILAKLAAQQEATKTKIDQAQTEQARARALAQLRKQVEARRRAEMAKRAAIEARVAEKE